MKNMVAIGATSAILNFDINVFRNVVQEIFGKKGKQVVEKNMEAIKAGYDYIKKSILRSFKPDAIRKSRWTKSSIHDW